MSSSTLNTGPSHGKVSAAHRKRFAKHVRSLNKLLCEIRMEEPDAQYYLANGIEQAIAKRNE